ncbi:response regulator [Paenibacillaceae bacterium]|nr:response regulator [Paenibacillaceae bacterium]
MRLLRFARTCCNQINNHLRRSLMTNLQKTAVSMCVIDDIESVVEGICTQIDWDSHGIVICGTALNGETGLALIHEHRPDIILTDIRMPKLDGMEVARITREYLPESKVLLLTGYTDFHYAQQAIGMGVFDFITKPFSLEQIEEAVLKARGAITDSRQRMLQLHDLEQQARESRRMKRQHVLDLLVRYATDEQSADEYWESLQIDMNKERLVVALLQIDHYGAQAQLPVKEAELTHLILHNIIEETISCYTKGAVFKDGAGRFVALFNVPPDMTPDEIASYYCENMSKYAKFTVSVGVGREVQHIHELAESYEQAAIALAFRFYTGGNTVYNYEQISRASPLTGLGSALEQELLQFAGCGNRQQAQRLLDEILEGLLSAHPRPEPGQFKIVCYQLTFLMLRTFHAKLDEDEFQSIPARLREHSAMDTNSSQELQRHLGELCELGCELINNKHRSDANKAIDEAVNYIGQHLHLELTVRHCAKQVHLSPSYFAAMFKRKMGCTFNSYLNQIRMERAKAMLLEDKQIQEVADALGYEERRYFTSVFKKNTGLTPTEFKQKYWQEETYQ